jgi:cold shock protein
VKPEPGASLEESDATFEDLLRGAAVQNLRLGSQVSSEAGRSSRASIFPDRKRKAAIEPVASHDVCSHTTKPVYNKRPGEATINIRPDGRPPFRNVPLACIPGEKQRGGIVKWRLAVGPTQGRVKWFNDAKGFGFISGNDGRDVFVHHTAILAEGHRTLKEGEAVEFDLEPGPKGPKATNVRVTEATSTVPR